MRPSRFVLAGLIVLSPPGLGSASAFGRAGPVANAGVSVSAARVPGGRGTANIGGGSFLGGGAGLRIGGSGAGRPVDGRFSAGLGGCGLLGAHGGHPAAAGRCAATGGAYGRYGAFGRFAYGLDAYGDSPWRDDTVRVEPPGLPSASGIRPSPVLPPAIYVIGGARPAARSRRSEASGTTSVELPGGARIVTIDPPAR